MAQRAVLIVWSLTECLILTGFLTRPNILIDILDKQEFFHTSCKDNRTSCEEQISSVKQCVYLSTAISWVLMLPVGFFYDKFGTLLTRVMIIFIFTTAMLTLAFTHVYHSWLLYISCILIGICGSSVAVTNVQTANLFVNHRNLLLVTLVSCSKLTSALLPLLLKYTSDQQVKIQSSFMFLTILILPLLIGTIAFLPKRVIPWPLPEGYNLNRPETLHQFVVGRRNETDAPSLIKSLKNPLFAYQILWYVLLCLRIVYFRNYLATQDRPTEINVTDKLSTFLCSLIAPAFGALLDRASTFSDSIKKFILCYSFILLLSSLQSALSVLNQTLIAACVVDNLLQASLYGTNAAFMANFFPHKHFGTLLGFSWALEGCLWLTYKAEIRYVNYVTYGCIIGASAFPILMYFNSSRRQRADAERCDIDETANEETKM